MMIPGLDVCPYPECDATEDLKLKSFTGTFCIPKSKIYGGCRQVDSFQCISVLKSSTSWTYRKCRDPVKNIDVCVKRHKNSLGPKSNSEKELNTLRREIQIVRPLKHDNVMEFLEPAVRYPLESVYLVFESCDYFLSDLITHENVKSSIFQKTVVKNILMQALRSLDYIHKNHIMHRDFHPKNLMFTKQGVLKLANFENAREFGNKDLKLEGTYKNYHAPELILDDETHGSPIDIWALGCLCCKMFLREREIYSGETKILIYQNMLNILGTPNERIWPGYSDLPGLKELDIEGGHGYNCLHLFFERSSPQSQVAIAFLNKIFIYDPSSRISAEKLLQDDFFLEYPTACSSKDIQDILAAFTKKFTSDIMS